MQPNLISPLLLIIFLRLPMSLAADDMNYFPGEIDYWNEPSAGQPQPSPTPESKDLSSPFEWGKYLDPKNKEFFQEGNYTPPDPFMEVVRNPSDHNLSMWFSYMNKKNELATRLQERMREYVGQRTAGWSEESKQALVRAEPAPVSVHGDTQRFRFRMYFDSTCPHCARMFETLKALQEQGYFVEARQIDSGRVRNIPIAFTRATPDELRKQNVRSVPLLLIGDVKNRKVYTLTGYQTVASIFQAIRQEGAL